MYRIDEKGQVSMVKEQSIASYSPPSNLNYVCDYFIK